MSFTCIAVEKSDGLAHIMLNRPDQLNAINRTMLDELWAACDEIEADRSLKVVTITGNGRAFCAGADLRDIRRALADSAQLDAFLHLVHKVFNRIEDLQKPVVAGVHGMALAGGLEIVLACDLAVAEEGALLGDQHANFGLVAGGGGTQRLSRVIGQRKAKELILLGNRLSAQEALAMALVNRVAPAGKLEETLKEVTDNLRAKSLPAGRLAKSLVNKGAQVDLHSGLEMELLGVVPYFQNEDVAEGLAAFVEKRQPRFSGR